MQRAGEDTYSQAPPPSPSNVSRIMATEQAEKACALPTVLAVSAVCTGDITYAEAESQDTPAAPSCWEPRLQYVVSTHVRCDCCNVDSKDMGSVSGVIWVGLCGFTFLRSWMSLTLSLVFLFSV